MTSTEELNGNETGKRPTSDIACPDPVKRERHSSSSSNGKESAAPASNTVDERLAEAIERHFYLKCPDDFVAFYKFCCSVNSQTPLDVLAPIDLHLVGPFSLLHKLTSSTDENNNDADAEVPSDACLSHRYFHDPPEMVTILAPPATPDVKVEEDETTAIDTHYGYFRDTPADTPSFIVANNRGEQKEAGNLARFGINVFAVVHKLLSNRLSGKDKGKNNNDDDDQRSLVESLLSQLVDFASASSIDLDLDGTKLNQDLSSQEVANFIDLRTLVHDRKSAIAFLQQHGLLHKQRLCDQGHSMRLYLTDKEDRWRCNTQACRAQKQLKSGTWLAGTHLKLPTVVYFLYWWSVGKTSSHEFCRKELEMNNYSSVVTWNNSMREICARVVCNASSRKDWLLHRQMSHYYLGESMWRERNKDNDCFVEILKDIARCNPLK